MCASRLDYAMVSRRVCPMRFAPLDPTFPRIDIVSLDLDDKYALRFVCVWRPDGRTCVCRGGHKLLARGGLGETLGVIVAGNIGANHSEYMPRVP